MAQRSGARSTEARARAQQRREQQRKAERRRQLLTTGGVLAAIVVVIAALVAVKLATNHKDKNVTVSAAPSVSAALHSVAAANFDQVGAGTATGGLTPVTGQPPLTAAGKPLVLYIGGEFCPYCAAERWALATTLSRFGTLSGLQTTKSSSTDVYPNTATLSFVTATYTSDYLAFTGKEISDRNGKALQALTAAESSTFKAIAPRGGIPFLDIGNKYFLNGSQYDPAVLKGLTAEQIAEQLSNPTSAVGKAVLGSANALTAAICTTTGNRPSNVCTAPGVLAAAKALTAGSGSGSS